MFINLKIREVYKMKRPYKNHSFGQNYGVALLGKELWSIHSSNLI